MDRIKRFEFNDDGDVATVKVVNADGIPETENASVSIVHAMYHDGCRGAFTHYSNEGDRRVIHCLKCGARMVVPKDKMTIKEFVAYLKAAAQERAVWRLKLTSSI
ncbi:MAG: hypothetical protein WCW14_03095 [Candidatus Paceibacterota bacterium]|jgi:hypothetical protein